MSELRKHDFEMENTSLFLMLNIQEHLTLLYLEELSSSLLQNRLSLTQVLHLFWDGLLINRDF